MGVDGPEGEEMGVAHALHGAGAVEDVGDFGEVWVHGDTECL